MDYDMEVVVNAITKNEDATETGLCLLHLLLPFQLRLEGCKEKREEVARVADDFTAFLTELRNRLLGGE